MTHASENTTTTDERSYDSGVRDATIAACELIRRGADNCDKATFGNNLAEWVEAQMPAALKTMQARVPAMSPALGNTTPEPQTWPELVSAAPRQVDERETEIARLRAVLETVYQMVCEHEGAANIAVTIRSNLDG